MDLSLLQMIILQNEFEGLSKPDHIFNKFYPRINIHKYLFIQKNLMSRRSLMSYTSLGINRFEAPFNVGLFELQLTKTVKSSQVKVKAEVCLKLV